MLSAVTSADAHPIANYFGQSAGRRPRQPRLFLPLPELTEQRPSELHCTSVYFLSLLCSCLKVEPPYFPSLPETFYFSEGVWWICNCLWLFDVWYMAWRVWLSFPRGFVFSPWGVVPNFWQEDSAGCTAVSDLCAEWAPWASQEGKSAAGMFSRL